eukprot:m.1347271 g.1347271  ORF g.1347271 m.1347271 type:complete len:1261 (-) comp24911_c1_seq2:2923-6705(-)
MASKTNPYSCHLSTLTNLFQTRQSGGLDQLKNELGGVEGLAKKLNTDLTTGVTGTPEDIETREYFFGKNRVDHTKPKTFWQLCLEAASDATLIMLEIAATISLVLETSTADDDKIDTAWIEGTAIYVTVIIVVLVTAFNDMQKEKQFRELQAKDDALKECAVVRGGKTVVIPITNVVVGDIMEVEEGLVLPADGVLLRGKEMQCDESALTGESDPILKDTDVMPWMLSGTSVRKGAGRMLVIAVGLFSEEGIINRLVTKTGEEEVKRLLDLDQSAGSVLERAEAEELHRQEDLSDEQAEEQAKRVQKAKGKKTSVLTQKLAVLAISIGKVGVIAAVLTVIGLIIRTLIDIYSDCASCKNSDEWGTDEWSDLSSFFITGITVLVVAIPEGLPLAVTIALAYSVKKMGDSENNCLVRVLASCEIMGNASTICSDKTGTLTLNRMTVVRAYVGKEVYDMSKGGEESGIVAKVVAAVREMVCEGASINSHPRAKYVLRDDGIPEQEVDKTECGLLMFADALGTGRTFTEYRQAFGLHVDGTREERGSSGGIVNQWSFDHDKKRMTTVVSRAETGTQRVYCKGAAEVVLAKCTKIMNADGTESELTDELRTKIHEEIILSFGQQALRAVMMAQRELDPDEPIDDDDVVLQDLTMVALAGIRDPCRPEVPKAVADCKRAGVTVRMLTGDHPATARAIAVDCGIIPKDAPAEAVMTGEEFRNAVVDPVTGALDYVKIGHIWPNLRVMARCFPSDKFNLVKGLIHYHEVVAVTGDGTNDAPALAEADVGFSMGLTGTQVAKQASDIVILDDNFANLVKAIKWGRNVYDSIGKFLVFQLTINVVAVLVAFIGAMSIGSSPLRATQMLWVNLIMDSFASLALATEEPDDKLLNRKPYSRDAPLVNKWMARQIFGHAAYQMVVMMFLLYRGDNLLDLPDGTSADHGDPPSKHLTVVFNAFVWMQLFNEINARKIAGELNVFAGLMKNPMFLGIMGIQIAGQIIIVQVGGRAMQTEALNAKEWGVCIAFGVGSIFWNFVLRFIDPETVVPNWIITMFNVKLDELDEEEEKATIEASEEGQQKSGVVVSVQDSDPQTGTADRLHNKHGSLNHTHKHLTLAGSSEDLTRERSGSINSNRSQQSDGSAVVPRSAGHAGWLRGVNRVRSQLRVVSAFQTVASTTRGMKDRARRLSKAPEVHTDDNAARALWKASVNTLRTQIRTVNAFQTAAATAASAPEVVVLGRSRSYIQSMAPTTAEADTPAMQLDEPNTSSA